MIILQQSSGLVIIIRFQKWWQVLPVGWFCASAARNSLPWSVHALEVLGGRKGKNHHNMYHSHHHCSRWPIWFLTVWFTQYLMCECLGQSSRIFWKATLWKYPRFATDVYLVEREQKEEAVEKMRRYFVTRNLNVHTRYLKHIHPKIHLSPREIY